MLPHLTSFSLLAGFIEILQMATVLGIVWLLVVTGAHQDADAARALLRARREWPRRRRAAEQTDELAPFHVWMAPAWQEKM
jgi:hypothetical protein